MTVEGDLCKLRNLSRRSDQVSVEFQEQIVETGRNQRSMNEGDVMVNFAILEQNKATVPCDLFAK